MAEEPDPSSKYDHITYKELIHSGSPSVYQLTPKNKRIGTLTKLSLGQRDPNRTNRTILLVGETGAGKSTLVNTLVNYAIGVTWEDNVWFEFVEEEDQRKALSESQTSDVIVYEIFGFEGQTLPFSLTIIDTPGYGDTRGAEQDDKVRERLLDLFRCNEGVYEINAVGLVLKASDNRLSDRLRYIFDSVVSLFDKGLEENIVTLITHSDGTKPQDALKAIKKANIKCAKNEKDQPLHFLFNNCQNSERTKQNATASQVSWEITLKGMREFTSFLGNKLPRNLKNTTEVLNSRVELTALIQNLQERVELIELKQTEIKQTEEALKKHQEEMKSNQNFTVEVDEPYKDKDKIPGGMWGLVFYKGAVSCNSCEENCHYPGCTLAWYPEHCEVMKKGKCTSCTKKCAVSDHVKGDMIYVNKTKKVTKTLQDVKQKYERSKADCEQTSGLLEGLELRKEELRKEKDRWLVEAYQHVLKLEEIALKTDSLSTHVDFLIEKMKLCKFENEVQKLEGIKRRVDDQK